MTDAHDQSETRRYTVNFPAHFEAGKYVRGLIS